MALLFQEAGGASDPLPLPLYSETFWAAYNKALAGHKATSGVRQGTLEALILDYYASAEWKGLADNTKSAYRRVLDRFRGAHGHRLVADLETHHVNKILDGVADHPEAASNLRDRLSGIMKFAIGAGYRSNNPVRDAKRIKRKSKGIRSWTEADIRLFRKRWPVGSPQRLAFEILLFTGLRRSDAVRLGPEHRKDGYFVISTRKSGELVTLEIPVHTTLDRHLAFAPEGPTYILTQYGEPRSTKAFGNWIGEAADKAGLPPDSSPHGLRKAACRRLAEAGCTGPMIQAITGHQSLQEVDAYIRAVNQKMLAKGAMSVIMDAFESS